MNELEDQRMAASDLAKGLLEAITIQNQSPALLSALQDYAGRRIAPRANEKLARMGYDWPGPDQ